MLSGFWYAVRRRSPRARLDLRVMISFAPVLIRERVSWCRSPIDDELGGQRDVYASESRATTNPVLERVSSESASYAVSRTSLTSVVSSLR
jgi:hypothetical protein